MNVGHILKYLDERVVELEERLNKIENNIKSKDKRFYDQWRSDRDICKGRILEIQKISKEI